MNCGEKHNSGLSCDAHEVHGMHSGMHPEGGRVFWRDPDDLLAISTNWDECQLRRWPGTNESYVASSVFPALDGAMDKCIARGLSHVFVVEQSRDEHVVVRNVYQDASAMVRMLDALTRFTFDGFIEWCMQEHCNGRLDLSASKFVHALQRCEVDNG